ncbi:glycosyl hydrolase family 28 protein [Dactylosporangium sp. NBC_01737]|uniref:glycosyl hydrolase family 28 protein n=1 Tax=Dactylosporangium sp. NBC_01737 TaxID=2975959 RepID=UPI002E14DC2D|nr:glycosyl hydrolase family 28 protein [Dactylosporangium sp. NBC_01737]
MNLPSHRRHRWSLLSRLLAVGLAAVGAVVVVVVAPHPANAAVANTSVYPVQSIYALSTDYTLTVNGRTVPVQKYASYNGYQGYDFAQFAMSDGDVTLAVTKINNTSIGAYSISPQKLGIVGSVSGPTLTFTVHDNAYLIVKVDGRPNLAIAIDPGETNRPPSSGMGIFNVRNAPYSVQPGSGYATTAFQQALNDAAAWGSANARQGIVYVPPGVYTVGNLYLRSDLALYLEQGAVLRYTGERANYTTHWHKESQNRDVTWFISTRYSSSNISIYGRGVIDGNGAASLQPSNLAVNLLTPIYTNGFTVDGVTFRESSSWAIMPTRSSNMTFRNLKIFNRFGMGENDGIDVMESSNVTVSNAIGIGHDDPFSTKTWDNTVDLFRNVPGSPMPLYGVTFEDLVSWTFCYGLKVGQGVIQNQESVTFRRAVVYDAAVGIGVHHKYGTGAASHIRFEDIDVERLSYTNDQNRTWLVLWTGNTYGVGPVNGVTVTNARIRNAGTTPGRINGQPGAPITGVTLDRVYMPGSSSPATSLNQMNITNLSDYGPVTISG